MLLLPTSDVKLLAQWQGPYVVNRRVGEVDYEIHTPDKRRETKVYHVNLLKKWVEREELACGGEDLGPSVEKIMRPSAPVEEGQGLSAKQRKDIQRLQREYQRVFSKKPRYTKWVQHTIKIKGGSQSGSHPTDGPST